MNAVTTTPERSASPGLEALSEDDFKQLIDAGGTLNIGQINAKLDGPIVNADLIFALGINTRRHRGAVHIDAGTFKLLAIRLALYILKTAHRTPA